MAQTAQDTAQRGESGDSGQDVDVTQSGDNSNQCVGVQPVSNTGNAQTIVDITIENPAGDQYTKRVDLLDLIDELDLDLEDIGSSIEINPELTVECAQQIEQAASAAGEETGYCTWYWDAGWWCYWSADATYYYYDYYGNYTAYDDAWYWDGYLWWWTDGYLWWWTDGYYWYWDSYYTVSNVAAGTLGAARGTLPLVTLGALALIGTGGILIRRNRRQGPEG
jgi:hypothetical protein